MMCAADSGFFCGHGEQALYQIWVEAGGQRDWLRKVSGVNRPVSVQALFVKDHRNLQAAVFQKEFLDFVGELRGIARVLPFSGVAWSGYLPDSIFLFEKRLCFLLVEVAVVVKQRFRAVAPNAHHLRAFLLESHAGEEVFSPLFRGKFRILVWQQFQFRLGPRTLSDHRGTILFISAKSATLERNARGTITPPLTYTD